MPASSQTPLAYCQGRSCLLDEAPLALGIRDFLRRQDFNGDEAIEILVADFVSHTHPALPSFTMIS